VYPGLRGPLLILVAVSLTGLRVLLIRQPVSRRLAFRQVARRRTEAALVVTGSVLGTAIIVGALIVGDTLNHSVRDAAYRTLGPIDERVVATDPAVGATLTARLRPLAGDPSVDGVLSGLVTQAAAATGSGSTATAEPRVLAWDLDLSAAAGFGKAGGDPGLSGPKARPGTAVVNEPLATSLALHVGEPLTLYVGGLPRQVTVARIVPERGLAGMGLGAAVNRNVFLAPGSLTTGPGVATVALVSNRGGVETGDRLTSAVLRDMRSALGPAAAVVTIDSPKHTVLDNARQTGDTLGALFLMIGSFSIIAGSLLLVNIFVMLAEERKSQLGMLRALGMSRSRLVGALMLEGATYAVTSVVPGILLGLGVGYGVALVAAQVFRTWSSDATGLAVSFAVTPTSLINGAALGLVISALTILLTAAQISRFNIIGAIRDLPPSVSARGRRGLLVGGSLAAVATAALAVPAVISSSGVPTLLLPSMAVLFAIPVLQRVVGGAAGTVAAGTVLTWTLVATVVRPGIFDTPSMSVFVVLGSLLAFSSVVLVSRNQGLLLWPVRRLLERSTQNGLAVRLAVAYPLAKRFRTGATLVMYTLITLVLVLLAEISGVINGSIDATIRNATAGFGLRVDVNPAVSAQTLAALRGPALADQVSEVAPILSAAAQSSDPGHRTDAPIRAVVVGMPGGSIDAMPFDRRMPLLASDRAVWDLIARNPSYVAIDAVYGSTGGPPGRSYEPGDTFRVTDPVSGRTETKRIAGILRHGIVFYPATSDGGTAYPIVASTGAVQEQFGAGAKVSAALLRLRPGVDARQLATRLQGRFLASSLVATPLDDSIRRVFAANTAFFRLMQGFLALGLLIGVTGLGVVMVRAVRERRRTVGVLRALGVRARTVARSFLAESTLVAVEGIVLGCVLGVLTTWLMYQKSAAFESVQTGFPIAWGSIAALLGVTLVASLAATLAPARRAAGIKPALAVRVAD
jgi:putative ABC transport system permease protein